MANKIALSVLLSLILFSLQAQQPAKPKPKPQSNFQQGAVEQRAYVNQPKPEKIYYVDILTSLGNIRVGLYNETPNHRDNFLKLIRDGVYDSLLFHRVINGFMIQGGDPLSRYADKGAPLGMGDVGYRIAPEIVPGIYHKRGALAAARDNNPDKASSGCQFYIVQGKSYTPAELRDMINNINKTKKLDMFSQLMAQDTNKVRIDDFRLRGDDTGLEKYLLTLQPVLDKMFEPYFFQPDPNYVQLYTTIGGAPHLDREYTVFGEVVRGMEVVDRIAEVQTGNGNRPLSDIRFSMRIVNP
jgi:cyclophilin family peptidyl-prolyl cis-trans isomerase